MFENFLLVLIGAFIMYGTFELIVKSKDDNYD